MPHKCCAALLAALPTVLAMLGVLVIAQAQVTLTHYYVVYDPVENEGLVEVMLVVNSEGPMWLDLPVNLFGESAELSLQNYSYAGNVVIGGLDYVSELGVLEALMYGTGSVNISFTARNLFAEIGVNAFELYIDTTALKGVADNVIVEVVVPGHYEFESLTIRGEAALVFLRERGNTKIRVTGIGEYLALLYTALEEPRTINQYWWNQPTYMAISIGMAVALVCVALIYHFRRRRISVGVIVERASYADNVTRAILKVLKDTSNRGLTQAEIAKLANLPKSSVSRRIRRLEEEKLVEVKRVGKYNIVYLTDKGLELAKKLLEEERGR